MPDAHHGTINQIELAVLAKNRTVKRPHLGASVLGHTCDRHVQLTFRWASAEVEPSARIRRLWDRGHREEAVFVQLLRDAHILVWTHDSDGKQFSFKEGLFAGSADGIVARIPEAPHTLHLLECKTHGEKSFKALVKDRDIELSHPVHFVQMQVYMLKLDLKAGLYLAVNKNTDELYAQRVKLNKTFAKEQCSRAEFLISEHKLAPPITTDPSWYECKMCPHYGICHDNKTMTVSCRTCAFGVPFNDPKDPTWICGNEESDACGRLSLDQQEHACEHYRAISVD